MQHILVATTAEGPIQVRINGVVILHVHSFEIRPVPKDQEDITLSPFKMPSQEQYELVLRFRPEEDGTQFKVFVKDQEVPLDVIRLQDGKLV